MQTRRDQLAACRYSVRRVHTALTGPEPEQVGQSMRRVASATWPAFWSSCSKLLHSRITYETNEQEQHQAVSAIDQALNAGV